MWAGNREGEPERSLPRLLVQPGVLGKGYATESATAMLRFGFERLRLHRVSAGCDVLNVSSCRVLEKLGMVREGHLRDGRYHQGRWRDTFVYGILAEEFLARNRS